MATEEKETPVLAREGNPLDKQNEGERPLPTPSGNDPKAADASDELLDEFQELKEFVGFKSKEQKEGEGEEETNKETDTIIGEEDTKEETKRDDSGCVLGVFCPWPEEHRARS